MSTNSISFWMYLCKQPRYLRTKCFLESLMLHSNFSLPSPQSFYCIMYLVKHAHTKQMLSYVANWPTFLKFSASSRLLVKYMWWTSIITSTVTLPSREYIWFPRRLDFMLRRESIWYLLWRFDLLHCLIVMSALNISYKLTTIQIGQIRFNSWPSRCLWTLLLG